MAHVNNNRDPRGNERLNTYTGDIEKQKNAGQEIDKLGRFVDVDSQTPKDVKKEIAKFIEKSKKKPKKQKELDKDFEALPLAAFSDFNDLVDEKGNLLEASSFAAQYVKNFGIDDPNYEVEIGEYEDGYTVYLKKKNA
jgi:hypothetical protein